MLDGEAVLRGEVQAQFFGHLHLRHAQAPPAARQRAAGSRGGRLRHVGRPARPARRREALAVGRQGNRAMLVSFLKLVLHRCE